MNRPRSRPAVAILDRLGLTQFKSFENATLPLAELTLLIGKNGSGKSNAIDGLTALDALPRVRTSATPSTVLDPTQNRSVAVLRAVPRMAMMPSSWDVE